MEVESIPLILAETLPVGTALFTPRCEVGRPSCYIMSQRPLTLWWCSTYDLAKKEIQRSGLTEGWEPNEYSVVASNGKKLYLHDTHSPYYKLGTEVILTIDETELWE